VTDLTYIFLVAYAYVFASEEFENSLKSFEKRKK
jgi:hypothetical protein